MEAAPRKAGLLAGAGALSTIVFHNTVRQIRKTHRDAAMAIATNVVQMLMMVAVFYFLFDMLGMRAMAIRGDFLLFVISGIFVFMTHVKALGAVSGAEGSAAPMMQHLPMSPVISVASAALGALYIQVLAMLVILAGYHLLWTPIEIDRPFGASMMMGLAWASGVAAGLVALAVKPWFPFFTTTATQLYSRVNMFASGKMFVANQLPAHLVALFWWNPLYHIIDQGRGYIFINYVPMKSELWYPVLVTLAVAALGSVGVAYTNRRESLSWNVAR